MAGRPLSKSRYRLGLECPTKIFYSLNAKTYLNGNRDNDFLRALADGGFQVGELACCLHMPGETVETLRPEDALAQTARILQRYTVTIFEAAFAAEDCFIRADIIRKQGQRIDLIEVKSKSIDPDADEVFTGTRGGIKAEWEPYLHDVAFQTFVVRAAMPGCTVNPYLMLADKSAVSPIDGLNGYFVLRKDAGGRISAHMSRALPPEAIDESVLCTVDVGDLVEGILADTYDGMTFGQRVALWAAASKEGVKIASKIAGSKCAGPDPPDGGGSRRPAGHGTLGQPAKGCVDRCPDLSPAGCGPGTNPHDTGATAERVVALRAAGDPSGVGARGAHGAGGGRAGAAGGVVAAEVSVAFHRFRDDAGRPAFPPRGAALRAGGFSILAPPRDGSRGGPARG